MSPWASFYLLFSALLPGVNGLRMLGVVHEAVVFLLEQLYGSKHCRSYRFRFHKPEETDEPPLNPHGSARAEIHHRLERGLMFTATLSNVSVWNLFQHLKWIFVFFFILSFRIILNFGPVFKYQKGPKVHQKLRYWNTLYNVHLTNASVLSLFIHQEVRVWHV